MMRSTQRQVAALVAGSVLLAFMLNFCLLFVLRTFGDATAHFPDRTALRIVAELYGEQPRWRAALLQHAESAGLKLREIPDGLVRACAEKSAPAATCPPAAMPRLRANAETWIGVEWQPGGPPGSLGPHFRLAVLLVLIGLPTLALSLWASRGVTAPLRRLTAQAEKVDPETVAAVLPVEGTTEIRLLAEAFNRLILRLTRYAADQRRMLAAVSHDLRTPLTRLRLRVDTIADPVMRQKLVRDVEAMQLLINRALSLLQAQDGAAACGWVDLPALLQTVADDMADAGVAATLGPLAPAQAWCDPRLLTRAVENLLENAAKYGGGGTLSLRCEGESVMIEVADHGPGLSEAERKKVFEPWYRGDAARGGQGNGLGLSIVQAVMAAQGGRVELGEAHPHGLLARLVLEGRPGALSLDPAKARSLVSVREEIE